MTLERFKKDTQQCINECAWSLSYILPANVDKSIIDYADKHSICSIKYKNGKYHIYVDIAGRRYK